VKRWLKGKTTMQIGLIGLGRMGGNIVRRLLRHGHAAVVYDRNVSAVQTLASEAAVPSDDLQSLVTKLGRPRTVWIMLPAGAPTEQTVVQLGNLLDAGDTVIDGGNSFYKDDVRRAAALKGKGIAYVDVGTSGGIWGLERGFCMMIGGERDAIKRLDPIFAALAPGSGTVPRTPARHGRDHRAEQGYIHAGPSGAGHFVKMIHNGIEYGLMQAYAEGFEILRHANSSEFSPDPDFAIDLADVAEVWRRGSVISSWLLDLTATALASDPKLESFEGYVEDSGEGRWTIQAAIDAGVPATVLSASLFARFHSRQQDSFAAKLLSAMRKGFGGHHEAKKS
jgi:6-phosphogluconate dehydrogenase